MMRHHASERLRCVRPERCRARTFATALVACLAATAAAPLHAEAMPDPSIDSAPDLRDSDSRAVVKDRERNFVIVPIPLSNPTLGTGLVVGGAYFYRQTEAQKKSQPASLTGAAGMYTSNDSYAYGIGQQSYWGGDKWRLSAVFGYADIELDLRPAGSEGVDGDWNVRGVFLQAKLHRRIAGDWYLGARGRYFDNEQEFSGAIPGDESFRYDLQLVTAGLGLDIEYDSRDLPTNPSSGRKLELASLFNNEALGSDDNYETYTGKLLSYHRVAKPLVLAWEVRGCYQSGEVPLWDACKVSLRGFPVQEYLGKTSASAQAEARWTAWRTIGFVGFAGAGLSRRSYVQAFEEDLIPSYGVGLRWMVLKSQRINLRIDYARSDDQDAWYLSVGEAF